MSDLRALEFLSKHNMSPDLVNPAEDALRMAEDMRRGLNGQSSSMPMIPTYLSADGLVPQGEPVAVIDAGGTNYRSALLTFTPDGYRVDHLRKWKMPGLEHPVTWEEFIAFSADSLMPFIEETDRIGYCFSYSAEITPEMDGRVIRIDKEVVVTGCEGKLLGVSLQEELKRRGHPGKKIVVLNDTVAVLLGVSSLLDRKAFDGFIGQVSGTGTNTCFSIAEKKIGKLQLDSDRGMVINVESGMYNGIPGGDFDDLLDQKSHNPGDKHFEKKTAGGYLGELCRLMLQAAAQEGALSVTAAEKIDKLGPIDSSVIDAWSSSERLDMVCGDEADRDFVVALSTAVFERSARCMCTNLAAIMLLTGEGKDPSRPVCICAEGSLVQKGRVYRPTLEKLIQDEILGKLGLHAKLLVGQETTLPGSAAAALLNT